MTTYEFDTLTPADAVPLPAPIQWQELQGRAAVNVGEPPKPAAAEVVTLRIELGRARVRRDEAKELRPGSIVPLDAAAAAPIDLYVGEQLVGRAEAVEINGAFAVRVLELFNQST